MTRALIADDEAHLATYLRDQLLKLWPELEIVAIARNGLEAAAQIAELQPDIAFLDIQMPGLTGLDVAAGIEGLTRVVFVTAYDEYALGAFDAEALDYVLKPVTQERLARTVERLKRALAPRDAASAEATDDARLARALRALQAPSPAAAPLRWIRASQGDRRRAVLPCRRQVHLRAHRAGRVPDPHADLGTRFATRRTAVLAGPSLHHRQPRTPGRDAARRGEPAVRARRRLEGRAAREPGLRAPVQADVRAGEWTPPASCTGGAGWRAFRSGC
jgi:CheY-like chemotaxis protein